MAAKSIARPPVVPALAAALALAVAGGCAHREYATALAETAPAAEPRPMLPAGYDAVKPPARDADGHYLTINHGLDPEATIWHVRAALNVAAIGCRGPEAAGIVPAYNAMLASKKAVLARAQKSVQAGIQASAGKDWQAVDDTAMTRLYNYFAMPAAKPAFCAAATALAPEAGAVPASAFAAFAATAMPRLDAPFTAVYRTVDDYQVALAAWQARQGAGTTRIAAADAPRLAYADIDRLLAWTPKRGEALASR